MRNTFSPYAHCRFSIYQSTFIPIIDSFLDQIASSFVPLHDQLIHYQVIEIYSVHILGQMLFPFNGGHLVYGFEDFIKDLSLMTLDTEIHVVETMSHIVTFL